jgi:hypothetical protein
MNHSDIARLTSSSQDTDCSLAAICSSQLDAARGETQRLMSTLAVARRDRRSTSDQARPDAEIQPAAIFRSPQFPHPHPKLQADTFGFGGSEHGRRQ